MQLSRLRLARDPALAALRPLLDPGVDHPGGQDECERGRRTDAHHRLIWTLFADTPDRRRDFLWRDEGAGRFTILSARPPLASPLFEPPETKPFAPDLRPGDRLAFALRVNATRARPRAEKHKRVDVVMDALRETPPGPDRAKVRMDIAQAAGTAWLAGQGARAGFSAQDVVVADYSVHTLPGHVGSRKGQPQYGILDMTGVLAVTDPAAFLARLSQGFGRARAFGCGLMLIRRV